VVVVPYGHDSKGLFWHPPHDLLALDAIDSRTILIPFDTLSSTGRIPSWARKAVDAKLDNMETPVHDFARNSSDVDEDFESDRETTEEGKHREPKPKKPQDFQQQASHKKTKKPARRSSSSGKPKPHDCECSPWTPLAIKREWWEPMPVGGTHTTETYTQRRYEVEFRCECGNVHKKFILAEDLNPDAKVKRMIAQHQLADDPHNTVYDTVKAAWRKQHKEPTLKANKLRSYTYCTE
jgi:hypothetical protein